jgi:hypothetical protein
MHPFFMPNFADANKNATVFALPRKSAAPQQSQKASFRFVFGLRDLCVAAKIGGASTKPESELSLCIRLARSLTC